MMMSQFFLVFLAVLFYVERISEVGCVLKLMHSFIAGAVPVYEMNLIVL
jgi:hypothetical protein